MLLEMGEDVYALILCYAGDDVLALQTVLHIPEVVFTYLVRARAGLRWPAGRAGLYSLYRAVHEARPYGAPRDRSVAWVGTDLHWTSNGHGYYNGICMGPCLCVSGPILMFGTKRGTVPVRSLEIPCTRIVQSAVLVCAWHASGLVACHDSSLVLHAICDTNTRMPRYMSVVGDVLCMEGYTWRNGRCTGRCPYHID